MHCTATLCDLCRLQQSRIQQAVTNVAGWVNQEHNCLQAICRPFLKDTLANEKRTQMLQTQLQGWHNLLQPGLQ